MVVAGTFSDARCEDILSLQFLKRFRSEITQPVARNDRAQLNNLPSQVFAEVLLDHAFEGGQIGGIAYPSADDPTGWNVRLFAGTAQFAFCESEIGNATGLSFRKAILKTA